jgi:hypothetical protein
MNNLSPNPKHRVTFKSPPKKKKKSAKRKSRDRQNKENNKLKLLNQAAEIMKSRHSAADKDFLNKFNEEIKISPATPTHHNLSQEDLMKLFSKENENINGFSCKNSAKELFSINK